MYTYKVLVIDDETLIESLCEKYKKTLKKKGLEIEFSIIRDEQGYNPEIPYDLLMVDYNLKHGFSTQLGNQFISMFRVHNKMSQVIFYSSEFEFKEMERKYKVPLKAKTIFELINELKINKIADKNNYNMMINVIEDCCKSMDPIPSILSRMMDEYNREGIDITYINSKGDELGADSVAKNILVDNEEGKKFKEDIIKTIFSVMLNYKY